MDATYGRVRGRWVDAYRAIDQQGQVVDVFVSARRNAQAAQAFLSRAFATTVTPRRIITDQARLPARAPRAALAGGAPPFAVFEQSLGARPPPPDAPATADAGLQAATRRGHREPWPCADAEPAHRVLDAHRADTATTAPGDGVAPTRRLNLTTRLPDASPSTTRKQRPAHSHATAPRLVPQEPALSANAPLWAMWVGWCIPWGAGPGCVQDQRALCRSCGSQVFGRPCPASAADSLHLFSRHEGLPLGSSSVDAYPLPAVWAFPPPLRWRD